ncbi:MAG: class I SAM-dependent methyltransferase [Chthoniobacter sp.]|uniref:class I SAM-dependent methyltransferase n=1 Tax=Chthoniobacter sp. TaxID=2510640 RepID=UPI0032A73349
MSRPAVPQYPHFPSEKWLSSIQWAAFTTAATNAHRLTTGPGGWVERLGDDVLISYKDDAARDVLHAGLRTWCTEHGYVPRRVFGKFLPRQNAERIAPSLLEGDATLPLTTVVEENGMRFGLDFGAGYSAGLFVDQRANRAFVRRDAPRRLLNTFAYTCSFSVAAALAGAETVSVDLSKKSIDRGRENFALNNLDAATHRFYADDVLDLLPRLARKNETFDTIILDPPTFSRGNKGRRFQVEEDIEALLLTALELAAPRARVLVSTNCTRLPRRALENVARFALKATRRAAEFHAEPPLPDIPPDAAAQTLWMVLK